MLENDFAREKREGDVEYEEKIDSCHNKIDALHVEYQKIAKALRIFETETLTKSSSNHVPFKSLKFAKVGDIIRVTSSSYNKSDKEIEILEDFPSYLHVEEIDVEKHSFLAKVVNRQRDTIRLSRYHAYFEKTQG